MAGETLAAVVLRDIGKRLTRKAHCLEMVPVARDLRPGRAFVEEHDIALHALLAPSDYARCRSSAARAMLCSRRRHGSRG